MTCPYEKLQGVATSRYVPVEVTRPDGSQYRTMAKVGNKLVEKLQELSEDKNVRNREPNLQQLPMRTKDAKRIKEAFNPTPCAEAPLDRHTPTGRAPSLPQTTMEMPDARMRDQRNEIDWAKIPVVGFENYELHPHQQETLDAIKQQAFESGYRAGLSGKPTLSMLALEHQIERIKNGAIPLIVCDERHPLEINPLVGWERLINNLNFGMRFSPSDHKTAMGRTLVFDFETYGGDWFRKVRVMPDYENLKQNYMREDACSKIKDEKDRHEAICRKLVKTYKKRRKAVRKVLDQIGGKLKNGNHDTTSDAPDSV